MSVTAATLTSNSFADLAPRPGTADGRLRVAGAALDLGPLRERFLQRLDGRATTLRDSLAALASTACVADALDESMLLFHSLAGSAGTYGVAGVERLARRGEAICEDALEAGSLAAAALDELYGLVESLSSFNGLPSNVTAGQFSEDTRRNPATEPLAAAV